MSVIRTFKTQLGACRTVLRMSPNWPAFARMARGYLRVNLLRKQQLRFVELIITQACNGRCRICSNSLYNKRAQDVLPPERWLSLIDECAELDVPVVCLLGGEPLLAKHLNSYISRIREHSMMAMVASNGVLATREKIRELKQAGMHELVVSLLSPDPAEHDEMLGIPGAFEKAQRAHEYCRQEGVIFAYATVLSHKAFTDGTFDRFVEMAESKKVGLGINPLIPTGAARDMTDDMLTCEDFKRLNEKSSYSAYISTHLTNNYFGFGCPAGNSYLGVNATGEILPCFFFPVSLGSAADSTLREAWDKTRRSTLFTCRHKMCYLAASKEAHHNHLRPIFADGRVPMPLEAHPKYDPTTGALANITASSLEEAVSYVPDQVPDGAETSEDATSTGGGAVWAGAGLTG